MKTLLLAILLSALFVGAWYFQKDIPSLLAAIKNLGMLAPFLFVLVYCFATIFFLPTMVLTLAGGAIFGPVAGTFLNLIGASIGASIAFMISRYVAYDWFNQHKGKRLNRLIADVEKRGWQFVALLRLLPLIPFNLVNYGLGITNIPLKIYVLTTVIFLIPGEIFYTYCGFAGVAILSNPNLLFKNSGFIAFIAIFLLITGLKFNKRRKKNKKLKHLS